MEQFNSQKNDAEIKKDSEASHNRLVREPGLNSLVREDGKKKAINSQNMAQTYLNTHSSLLESYERARKENPVLAEKINKDLSDFYKAVSNRFNTNIRSTDDFSELMNSLQMADDRLLTVKNEAEKLNERTKDVISRTREEISPVSKLLNSMNDRQDEIRKNLSAMSMKSQGKKDDKVDDVVDNSILNPTTTIGDTNV